MLEPGDTIRVISGEHQGKTGTIQLLVERADGEVESLDIEVHGEEKTFLTLHPDEVMKED